MFGDWYIVVYLIEFGVLEVFLGGYYYIIDFFELLIIINMNSYFSFKFFLLNWICLFKCL